MSKSNIFAKYIKSASESIEKSSKRSVKIYLITMILAIIIMCIIYLVYRYLSTSTLYEKNVYEKFTNTEPLGNSQALGMYFQNTINSDDYMDVNKGKYRFNTVDLDYKDKNNRGNGWDGIWRNETDNINAVFIQQNDNLFMSFANSDLASLSIKPKNADGCTDNLFLGRGQLNKQRNIFKLNNIKCNTYENSNLKFTKNTFTGILDKTSNTITLTSPDIIQKTILNKVSDNSNNSNFFKNYIYSTNYILDNDPYATSSPSISQSYLEYDENFCENPNVNAPCIDKAHGLTSIEFGGRTAFNACGKKDKIEKNTGYCGDGPNNSGICSLEQVDGFTQCRVTSKLYDYINFMPYLGLSQMSGDTPSICTILNNFGTATSKCNTCILTYVENIVNVQTLNYEFNSVKKGDNSLTLQYDYMNTLINKYLLLKYREQISNVIESNSKEKVLSLINCIDKESNETVEDALKRCTEDAKVALSNYKDTYVNKKLSPALWEIKTTLSNSCTFTLNTSSLYNTQKKYVECNNDGSTSLTLYKEGQNQKLVLENPVEIKKSTNPQTPFIVFTANIRSYNKLYLLPSPDNTGFHNNSHKVRLGPRANNNGKWLIFGFSLSNLNDLETDIKNKFIIDLT